MDYQEAIEYIDTLALREQKRPDLPSLGRIETFLSYYNGPQNSFTTFHIGGTNGKGSTVAMLDSILRQGKKKIGRFTGPHLLRYNERFHINGQPITDNELAERVSTLKTHSEKFSVLYPQFGPLSWFEFLTALAFFYFAESTVDIAVIEVGLGGRFDATNVLSKLYATGITNISLDHEHILGSSLESIASEKAGIIKTKIPVITAACEPALSVIAKRAAELGSPLTNCGFQTNPSSVVQIQLKKIKKEIYRHGLYQYQNALMTLTIMSETNFIDSATANGAHLVTQNDKISIEKALDGLRSFYWPGRFQIIQSEQIILDGAHNPAGTKALRESLGYLYPEQCFHFIFACYNDKDASAMLKHLVTEQDKLYLPSVSGKRSFCSATVLNDIAAENGIKASTHANVFDALSEAKAKRKNNEFIVIAGSFAVVREAVVAFGWRTVEDGIN